MSHAEELQLLFFLLTSSTQKIIQQLAYHHDATGTLAAKGVATADC